MDLGRVEHAQDDDVVTAGTEVAEPGFQQVRRREQVGDQDDQAALLDRRGDLFERPGEVGGAAFGVAG